jgi:MFS family permease
MLRSPLYRHGNFLRLWVAQTVSLFGAQITTLALPTVAIILLHASPFEVGALAAMPWLAYVGVGLIAGVIADQLPRRPLMVTADLARALALGSVPLAFAFGILSLAHLYLVAAAVGVCNVFFDVSYQSYLPTLLERDQLLEGNAKLVFGQAAAWTGGPAIGGLLIGAVGGALAIIANAFSFLFSAICLGAITQKEEAPSREPKLQLNTGIAEIVSGIRFVMRQPVIRTLTSVSAMQNFGEFMADPMLLIFMYVELHLSPSIVGLTVAIGSAGFLLGAALAARITSKLGIGPMLAVSSLLGGMAFLVLPLGQLGFPPLGQLGFPIL